MQAYSHGELPQINQRMKFGLLLGTVVKNAKIVATGIYLVFSKYSQKNLSITISILKMHFPPKKIIKTEKVA